MKNTKKITLAGLGAACALTLSLGVGLLANTQPAAMAETSASGSYYYNMLLDNNDKEYTLAKKFYDVLEELNDKGDFKDGIIDYSLTDIVTPAQIKDWVDNGNLEIPKAFGAARDSFMMDHPELFYIDVYKIMISAGYSNGVYSAYIDCGKEANIYRNRSFQNEQQVNKALDDYNAAIKAIADEATEKVEGTTENRDKALAITVNEIFAGQTYYDYDTYNQILDGSTSMAPTSLTAYGALVLHKAVCAGYSFAYKAILDSLDVPCVVVSGYSKGKDKKGNDTENDVGHSWNYVKLETGAKEDETAVAARAEEKAYQWFAFDTTWNSVQRNINKYSAMDYITASEQHTPNGVISSSGYSLRYPALSAMDYRSAVAPSGMDNVYKVGGFNCETVYRASETTWEPEQHVSYNGKNANELLDTENLRIAFRSYYMDSKDGQKKWSQWQDAANSTDFEASGAWNVEDNTYFYVNQNVEYTQFAVLKDITPDVDVNFFGTILKGYYYSEDAIKDENIVFMSDELHNEIYGVYTAPPYINTEKSTPYMGGVLTISDGMCESGDSRIMKDEYATLITLIYDEPLHILDESKPIEVYFTPALENARKYSDFVAFDDGEYVHLIADANGEYNTLQFKFKPSLMYEHDRIGYSFTFGNVGSSKIVEKKGEDGTLTRTTSDKTPNSAYFVWSRVYMACPKVFGDGRLWVECCAQPELADNSDLSAMNFLDEDGNSTFTESARSQMMLVVNDISPEDKNTMFNEISADSSINVNKEDIEASQTYDIRLSICGQHATIPDGSYVKITLGFPQGYGPENEGVTFKLFHRKHDPKTNTYTIEEVPCVVTKFGIVATVTSFSPYMVAVVPEEKATAKTVYASIDGNGGRLSLEDGQIRSLNEGESYTYTIKPDDGYMIYSVTLNDKDVKGKINSEGKLTLTYEELESNNELKISYISHEAARRYVEKEIIEPVTVVISTSGEANKVEGTGGKQEIDVSEIPAPKPGDEGNVPPTTPGGEEGNVPPTTPGGDEGNVPGSGTTTDVGSGNNTDKPDNTVLIVVTVVVVVVAVAVAVAAVLVIRKKKNS